MKLSKSILWISALCMLSAGSVLAQVTEKDYTILAYTPTIEKGAPIEKAMLFKGDKRVIAQVTLRDGKSMGVHTEQIPFLVYTVSGKGALILGDKEKSIPLEEGSLVTVEAGIPHDVAALPELSILVIKLTGDPQ